MKEMTEETWRKHCESSSHVHKGEKVTFTLNTSRTVINASNILDKSRSVLIGCYFASTGKGWFNP